MRRVPPVAIVFLILGIAVGAAGYKVLFDKDNKAGVYCYHPNTLNPFKQTCIRVQQR